MKQQRPGRALSYPREAVVVLDPQTGEEQPLTQANFDAVLRNLNNVRAEVERLKRLCQTHGLLTDG